MPTKTHAERIQICLNRLQQARLLDSARSDVGQFIEQIFSNEANPEVITKNLLFMHQNNFNFNDSVAQKQLLDLVYFLSRREAFFKGGFESSLCVWGLDKCPALKTFRNEHLNKDQSSSMYFGLKALEESGYFATATGSCSAALKKEYATKLLATLEKESYHYRIQEADESYDEKSIDLLPERVAHNFVTLRQEGYAGIFAAEGGGALWGGVSNGLSEKMLRVLANPTNEKELGSFALSYVLAAMSTAISTGTARRQESSFSAMFLANEVNQLGSSTDFLNCWQRVLAKMKFLEAVAADNNEQLMRAARGNNLSITPNLLREAYARLPSAPTSELNHKLVLMQQQGILEATESAVSESSDPIVRNMQVALRNSNAAPTVNWADALTHIPLVDFSAEAIAQRTRLLTLLAIAKLDPVKARSALALETLTESQQAEIILVLQKNNCVIEGGLEYLSGLLRTASPAHGTLLISYFLTDRYNFVTNNLKDLSVLAQWKRVNVASLEPTFLARVDRVIEGSMQSCIISTSNKWYSKSKECDQIRQAWKLARETSVNTEAETVYRAVQKARESNPANVKAVSQLLSDYMTKNPTSAFAQALQKVFGDFFVQVTPSRATPTVTTCSIEKSSTLKAASLEQ